MEEMTQWLPVAVAVLVLLAAAATHLRSSSSRHCAGNTRRTVPVPVPATIEVRDPEAARRMIVDHADTFSDHPAVPFPVDLDAGHPKTTSINSAPYGPLWRALRCNLTAGVLHPSRLAHLAPLQRDAVESLVADLAARGRGGAGRARDEVVAVRDALYTAVFKVVARMCFGDDGIGERDVRAMQRTLREFFHSGVDARRLASSRLARLLHWRQWRYLVGTRGRLAEVFVPAIAARRRRLRRSDGGGVLSYIDTLLDLRVPDDDDGEPSSGCGSGGSARRRALRDDEMVRLVWEFLGAGTETVVACVEWTLARLVAHPEVQDKLHRELSAGDQRSLQDLPYLRAVILESLRLHPPVPFILRDVVGLPEGAAAAVGKAVPLPPPNGAAPVRFVFMAEDIGRDPKAWTDAEEFRPERFIGGGEGEDVNPIPGPKEIRMMPFGAGRRHCPGAGLAVIQAKCFVAALVREFEWAPPARGGGVDHTPTNALFLKVMASPLRARIVPRRS